MEGPMVDAVKIILIESAEGTPHLPLHNNAMPGERIQRQENLGTL